MIKKQFGLTFAMASLAISSFGQTPAADHLVISEVGIAMPSGNEFTEIYNPTLAAVDLTNYYITDHNLYFDLPSVVSGAIANTLANNSDHLRQFPAGASIPSGGTVVVVNDGTKFLDILFQGSLSNFTNQPGNPQLFEALDSDLSQTIPNMGTNYNRSSPDYPLDPQGTAPDPIGSANINHTDGGESVVLFYWDGQSSLVKDLDWVQYLPKGATWGASSNQIANKSSVLEQGPNGTPESYLFDFGGSDNLTAYFPAGDGAVMTRRSLLEAGETQVGGNGLNGHDESLEQVNLTWKLNEGHIANHSAGLTNLGLRSANQLPVVGSASRNIQNPTPGSTVRITAKVYDDAVIVPKLMVDKGTGYLPTPMVAEGNNNYGADIITAGLADGTHVKWYVSATDAGGLTATEADYQELHMGFPALESEFLGYHVFRVQSAPPVLNDLVLTEIMANPAGFDNDTHSQYFEVYNSGSTPINLGGYVVSTSYVAAGERQSYITIPSTPDTIIPAKGYLVFTGNKQKLMKYYPGMNPGKVVDFGMKPRSAIMAHAGSTILLWAPNDFNFDGTLAPDSAAVWSRTYANVAPWPTGSNNNGFSMELTTPTPGADAVGANWAVSKVYDGTPLAANSTDNIARKGDVQILTTTRDIVYPSSTQQITITAVTSSTLPIATAQIMAKTGTTFVATPMTSTDGVTFTGQIGPFPDNTLVKYYVVATDTAGDKGTYPYIAPVTTVPFFVDNTPAVANAIVINEIMYNPYGSDGNNYPEFIELYNRTFEPVNLSFYYYGTSLDYNSGSSQVIPEGTIIPARGYLVLGQNRLFLDEYYSDIPNYITTRPWSQNPDLVVNNGFLYGSTLGNANITTVYLAHTNETQYFAGLQSATLLPNPFLSINYLADDTSLTWPTDVDGSSIELKDPSLDPNNGANWNSSPRVGTPGHRNSQTVPPSLVSDWTIY